MSCLYAFPKVSTPSWQPRQTVPNEAWWRAMAAGFSDWWQAMQVTGVNVTGEPGWQSRQPNEPPWPLSGWAVST